jgi:hypothetical protein
MLFLIVHPEWRNWQTRWTQKRASHSCSNLPKHTKQFQRVTNCLAYALSKRVVLFCLLLTVWLQISNAQERKTYTVPFHTVRGMILLDGRINDKPVVFLLDTGASFSIVDFRSSGFDSMKLNELRPLNGTGASGECAIREVKLSLEHRSWFGRRICIMDLKEVAARTGEHVDGFIGTDVLSEFRAVRIDYKAQTVTLEK